MGNIKLIVIKEDAVYDMSDIVVSVKWSGRLGSASRTLDVTFQDDDAPGHTRAKTSPYRGHRCIFYWKNKELFRGMFMRQDISNGVTMTAKAYDMGIYLANNRDTFNYTDTTAGVIFQDVCKRFEIRFGATADTVHRIPELTKPRTTGWDVICDALEQTWKATGKRFAPICVKEEMQLLDRKMNVLQWVIEPGVNLISWKRTNSIEKIKTRLKILSKEGGVVAEAKDEEIEKRLGIFQDVEDADEEMNEAQLNEYVQGTLAGLKIPNDTLNVSALGRYDVFSGIAVYMIIPKVSIKCPYYVDEDTHTFQGNYHQMDLKLLLGNGQWV